MEGREAVTDDPKAVMNRPEAVTDGPEAVTADPESVMNHPEAALLGDEDSPRFLSSILLGHGLLASLLVLHLQVTGQTVSS